MPANGQNGLGANLTYTKFIFVRPHEEDATTLQKIRTAGSNISRGFFNDFDADGSRDPQPQETIQFLQCVVPPAGRESYATAPFVAHVSANYRPRLEEVVADLQRRIAGSANLVVLEGAERTTRYTSAEMHNYAYKKALPRSSGRSARNAIIIPMSKSAEWWDKSALERHSYFYPHKDSTGTPVKGHAQAAEAGIPKIFRRLYHNPDGYQRADEFDFITYFECTDESLPVFDQICRALRDPGQNPEWQYVKEGPEWRGTRVLRW